MERVAQTRRAFFGTSAKLGALVAIPILPLALQARAEVSANAEFIRAIGAIHPNGEKVARLAISEGMKPADLFAVMTGITYAEISDNPREAERWPALLFGTGKANFTFRPNGEKPQ